MRFIVKSIARRWVVCGFLVWLAVAAALPLYAQTGDEGEGAATTSPELEALILEVALATKKAELAKQRGLLVDEVLGTPEIKALDGTATIEGDLAIEAAALAYEQLAEVGRKIAEDVCASANKSSVFVHSQTEINGILQYERVSAQLAMIDEQFQTWKTSLGKERIDDGLLTAFVTPVVVTQAISAAANIVSLFRTNVTINRSDITVEEASLVAAIAANTNCSIYYPASYPPNLLKMESVLLPQLQVIDTLSVELRNAIAEKAKNLTGTLRTKNKKLLQVTPNDTAWKTARGKARSLQEEINKLPFGSTEWDKKSKERLDYLRQVKEREAEIKKEKLYLDEKEKVDDAAAAKKGFDGTAARMEAAITAYDAMKTSLTTVAANGVAPLDVLLRAEKLFLAMTKLDATLCSAKCCQPQPTELKIGKETCYVKPTGYMLALKSVKTTGSEMTRRNLWTFGGVKILHQGGAIVDFLLYEPSGKIKKAGVYACRSEWRVMNHKKVNEPQKLPEFICSYDRESAAEAKDKSNAETK